MENARLMKCPGCGKMISYSLGNPDRPFCGKRCRIHDIALWAEERYRIPQPFSLDAESGLSDQQLAEELSEEKIQHN